MTMLPDRDWMRAARPVRDFTLDVGFATPDYCPSWLLPTDAAAAPAIHLPDLPCVAGCVRSADATGHERVLADYYRQFPKLPPPRLRQEAARWQCFEVPVLLSVSNEPDICADSFGDGHIAARALLMELADAHAPPFVAYDNLDQGWALEIVVEQDTVLVLDWSGEPDEPEATRRALRFSRAAVAQQAAAAARRLDALLPLLIAAAGADLWTRQGIAHAEPGTVRQSPIERLWRRFRGPIN